MIQIIRTAKRGGERWKVCAPTDYNEAYHRDCPTVVVDSSQRFQTHYGFGAAVTGAAAAALEPVDENVRREVIAACFSDTGLGYNLSRTTVHSCDFSKNSYTYIQEGDASLASFDMSADDTTVLPLLKECDRMAGGLTLFASCWSPPAFMKDSNELYFGGRLKKEYRKAFAQYLVNYLLGMRTRGVEIECLSVQNEPEAVQVWESRLMSAEEERDFIAEDLLPLLKQHKLKTKLIIWDHNRDRMVRRAAVTFSDPKVREAVWGLGYHWYVSNEHKNLACFHALYPEKHMLLTESCVELTNTAFMSGDGKAYAGEWSHGEYYGRNIIEDFNRFSEGWIDWNMVLDAQGGPNHVGNYCEAPIMIGRDGKAIYNPSYYYIGHFSRYIRPGARRLLCENDCGKDVYATAYRNPDGKIAVVLQNEGWVTEFALVVDGKGVNVTLPDHAIATILLDA